MDADFSRKFNDQPVQKMSYNFTAYYKTEEERIKAITEDILTEYPNLGYLAEVAAKMETPFGQVHEDYELFSNQDNHINRLINIVIVTEGKPEFRSEHEKACRDLREQYYSWETNFTYANPEEQEAYLIWEQFTKHLNNPSVPLYTYAEARDEQRRRRKEKERKTKIEMRKSAYPGLGDLAKDLLRLEEESGLHIRFQEDDLLQLFYIAKLASEHEGYEELYNKTVAQLQEKYAFWFEHETRWMSDEKKVIIEMMNRLNEHLANQNIPIATFVEMRKEMQEREQNQGQAML